MNRRHLLLFPALILPLTLSAASVQPPGTSTLRVVSAAPNGEAASLADANEIRVVFSEPMVDLGRIPSPVTAPFFRIQPQVAGTFRWSGTTVLVFTPDPKRPLPLATSYRVTIDTTAKAVSGRTLPRAFTFSFTTPTVKLLRPAWYRRDGRIEAPILVTLRFNQPVRPEDVAAHLSARFQKHPWSPPVMSPEAQARARAVDPKATDRFNAKVAATAAAASADGPVELRLATDWNKKLFPPSPDLVVLESVTPIPPDSLTRLVLDEKLPSPAGPATPGRVQEYSVEAEAAFFAGPFYCVVQCDPEAHNPLQLRRPVTVTALAAATTVADITTPGRDQAVAKAKAARPRRGRDIDSTPLPTLEDAGFDAQPPAKTYAVTLDANLRSTDGQTLGYTWVGIVENWHRSAFTSFGDGHGVWESSGGPVLPFYARNLQDVKQWTRRVDPSELMPTLLNLQANDFTLAPAGEGRSRTLPLTADRIQSHGLDMSGAIGKGATGLVWAAVEEGKEIARARRATTNAGRPLTRATLVQATNLGISVKDSPQNTLIFVTRLDDAAPVAGAKVSIVRLDNSTFWTGTTGADGVALAPQTPLRDDRTWMKFAFIVTAEKDGDVAYVGSDWNEGVMPWAFGLPFDLVESTSLLRGSVFADRGVYRLGEEVHLKAILRANTPTGVRPLPAGTAVSIAVRDSEDRLVDRRSVTMGKWSSAEWTLQLPADGSLGDYSVRAYLEGDRRKDTAPPGTAPLVGAAEEAGDRAVPYEKLVYGSFLVAAYRRPDFRVDVKLASDSAFAGDTLAGAVSARYLFGAPMGGRPTSWTFSRSPIFTAPAAVFERFPAERWAFVGWSDEDQESSQQLRREQTALPKTGDLALELKTTPGRGMPYTYVLEADVEDISRQHIANRAQVTVHPASWYIGLRRPSSSFVQQKTGLTTEVIAVTPAGQSAAGVVVDLELSQIQWKSVRRAEGDGFYGWESTRTEVPAGKWQVTTGEQPASLAVPFTSGGSFVLRAIARDKDGRLSKTNLRFYVLGDGYTAWARYDHNRIDLVAERQTYRPGDTARIMIQSPWEQATALVTTEREGIRTHRQFALASTQQSIEIPIAEQDIPNVYVSVLLVKGRTKAPVDGLQTTEDTSDPGKPAFRLGYVDLLVENASKRLAVTVAANKPEYRPANTAQVSVAVRDVRGAGVTGEVTLWAVDYGVLSLTDYKTPDVLGSVYVHKALQVLNEDNRQRIVSRRVLTPKGATEGGGGGADAGAGTLRKDFRVLAFWLGSVVTDATGNATVKVKLPESLTTYRIMAVAADLESRFGSGESEVRINKPVTLKAAFPRFLAVGDKAFFGAVVTSQLGEPRQATVTIRSLDPNILSVLSPAQQTLPLPAGGSVEARIDAAGRAVGRARIQVMVKAGSETDAFEDTIPVEVLASPETVAAYGEAGDAKPTASETVTIPAGVVRGVGGLHVEISSTAMVGLADGAAYLVEYPYGCAEQRASRALALLLAADLGGTFQLPGVDAGRIRPAVQTALNELRKFQCPGGGFAYWPGDCRTASAYLTAYILHVLQVASNLKYDVDAGVRNRAYGYLAGQLSAPPSVNEGWWPSYTAWQAFAVKVLVEGGRNQDSNLNRLYGYRDRMPVFALAYMIDALRAKGETTGARVDDLRRRLANATLTEAGASHVEELSDPYLLWYWNSNVRSTAIALNTLVASGGDEAPIRALVRWLMAARRDGRWGNTQENATAMEALVAYYRKYEAVTPDFRATVKLGSDGLARREFKGRSTRSAVTDLPMAQLLAKGQPGTSRPLTFSRDGAGTLFYTARLKYAADQLFQDGLDSGMTIERVYAPFVENGPPANPATSFAAGDLVRVTLTFRLTKERRFVAVVDPLPAGFEPIESWFATTAAALAGRQDDQPEADENWFSWWQRGGFDHVERHDDRVQLFATRLSEGTHTFSYIVRATTAGTFRTAPARAEEMYQPEVFGRTGTAVVDVKR